MKNIYILFIGTLLVLFGLSCGDSDLSSAPESGSNGTLSGSYANLLTLGDRLYMVTESQLITFDISESKNPIEIDRLQLDFGVESLFRKEDLLFVGSQTTMYIYKLNSEGVPILSSTTDYLEFENFTICDPIVAIEDFAYVTLSSDFEVNTCGGSASINVNELRVYDLMDLNNPRLINSIEMNEPKGLAVDDRWLFVCEKNNGLKVFDISNREEPVQRHHFSGFKAFDVIPVDGLLLVVGPDDLYQYDYSDMDNMTKISSISL